MVSEAPEEQRMSDLFDLQPKSESANDETVPGELSR